MSAWCPAQIVVLVTSAIEARNSGEAIGGSVSASSGLTCLTGVPRTASSRPMSASTPNRSPSTRNPALAGVTVVRDESGHARDPLRQDWYPADGTLRQEPLGTVSLPAARRRL